MFLTDAVYFRNRAASQAALVRTAIDPFVASIHNRLVDLYLERSQHCVRVAARSLRGNVVPIRPPADIIIEDKRPTELSPEVVGSLRPPHDVALFSALNPPVRGPTFMAGA